MENESKEFSTKNWHFNEIDINIPAIEEDERQYIDVTNPSEQTGPLERDGVPQQIVQSPHSSVRDGHRQAQTGHDQKDAGGLQRRFVRLPFLNDRMHVVLSDHFLYFTKKHDRDHENQRIRKNDIHKHVNKGYY